MTADKADLRKMMRNRRTGISATDRARAGHAAAEQLLALEVVAKAGLVAVYASAHWELDTAPLITALRERGVALAYPRVSKSTRQLTFHRVSSPKQLHLGSFDIPEPSPTSPTVGPDHLDVIVVPGLAFDTSGSRLGWGQGHYDATFEHHHRAVRIGYAFACQLVETVPIAPWDLPMDAIVTEQRAHLVTERTGSAESKWKP